MLIAAEARERRAHERHLCDLRVTCYPIGCSGKVRWRGRISDVSCGGVRLAVPRWFEEGTILKLHVEPTADSAPLTLLARVLHVAGNADGGWSLGCHVTPNLDDQDLEAMLQECLT